MVKLGTTHPYFDLERTKQGLERPVDLKKTTELVLQLEAELCNNNKNHQGSYINELLLASDYLPLQKALQVQKVPAAESSSIDLFNSTIDNGASQNYKSLPEPDKDTTILVKDRASKCGQIVAVIAALLGLFSICAAAAVILVLRQLVPEHVNKPAEKPVFAALIPVAVANFCAAVAAIFTLRRRLRGCFSVLAPLSTVLALAITVGVLVLGSLMQSARSLVPAWAPKLQGVIAHEVTEENDVTVPSLINRSDQHDQSLSENFSILTTACCCSFVILQLVLLFIYIYKSINYNIDDEKVDEQSTDINERSVFRSEKEALAIAEIEETLRRLCLY